MRPMPAQGSGVPRASYPFTPEDDANALLAESGTALLIGLCLEQQVRSEKAMSGPLRIRERLGHLDAAKIGTLRDATIESVFAAKPAIHRFPGMMARRVKALCKVITSEYRGDGANLWKDRRSAEEIYDRLLALPGFGAGKAGCGVRILAKFGHVPLRGWQRFGDEADMPWVFKNGKRVDV